MAFIVIFAITAYLLDHFVPDPIVTSTARFALNKCIPIATQPKGGPSLDCFGFDELKKSQIAILKSDRLLNAAINEANLHSLEIFEGRRDAVAWLRKHLDFDFQEDSQTLLISLTGTNSEKDDLSTIVNAVASAYNEELKVQRKMGPLILHDLLARNLAGIDTEIHRKLDEYLDIEREMGPMPPEGPLQRLNGQQLQQEAKEIQTSLNEAKRLNPESESTKQLRRELDTYINELKRRIEGDPMTRLTARHRDLLQLQTIAHDIAFKLENLDHDASDIIQFRQVTAASIEKIE